MGQSYQAHMPKLIKKKSRAFCPKLVLSDIYMDKMEHFEAITYEDKLTGAKSVAYHYTALAEPEYCFLREECVSRAHTLNNYGNPSWEGETEIDLGITEITGCILVIVIHAVQHEIGHLSVIGTGTVNVEDIVTASTNEE